MRYENLQTAGTQELRRREDGWSDQLEFRRIQKSDIEKVKQLDKILFPIEYNQAFYDRMLQPDMYTRIGLSKDDKETLTAVATVKIKTHYCRYISGQLEEGLAECISSFICGRKEGYISTIGVSPEYRKQGLASYMLEQMAAELQELGCRTIALHVKADNEAAIRFYRKQGFKVVEELPKYYFIGGKWCDAYHMRKTLPKTIGHRHGIWYWNWYQWFSSKVSTICTNT